VWPACLTANARAAAEEFLAALKDVYGERLHSVVLYGSIARGEGAVPDSDADLLVVLEGPVSPVDEIWRCSEVTAAISLKHDLVLSPRFMARERFETGGSPLLLNVRREGVRL
jgi:predicted nucleotidyltransferase